MPPGEVNLSFNNGDEAKNVAERPTTSILVVASEGKSSGESTVTASLVAMVSPEHKERSGVKLINNSLLAARVLYLLYVESGRTVGAHGSLER